jgi:predicted RNase H-like HicB family nuclease
MRTLEKYLDLPYHISIVKSVDEDGDAAWVSAVEELPGCISQGDTPEEAACMIRDAMEGWLRVALAHGDKIPEPRSPNTYKGQFMVRLPGGLHRALDRGAQQQGVSLNQYIATLLAGAIGWTPELWVGRQAKMLPGKAYPVGRGAVRTWETVDERGRVHRAASIPKLRTHLSVAAALGPESCTCSQPD